MMTPRSVSGKARHWVLLVLATAAAGFFFTRTGSGGDEKEDKTPPALVFSASDVVTIAEQALPRRIKLSGSLETPVEAQVKPKVGGQLLAVLVREGEAVRRGQVLARIDTSDLQARLDAARAEHADRRARLVLAEANRNNNRALLQRQYISRNATENTESLYLSAIAAVDAAAAQVTLARNALRDAEVVSPIAGHVAKRHLNAGERANTESPIVTVVDLSSLELAATIPAADVAHIRVGQAVAFAVDGFGAQDFSGRIERINPVADAANRTVKIFAAVPNGTHQLRGGLFATGSIAAGDLTPALVVPATAISEEAGQRFVLGIEGGKIVRHPVRVGREDDTTGLVTLESGPAKGTPIVRVRMATLKEGTPATINQSTNPSPAKS